jgi:hypothetical protein
MGFERPPWGVARTAAGQEQGLAAPRGGTAAHPAPTAAPRPSGNLWAVTAVNTPGCRWSQRGPV